MLAAAPIMRTAADPAGYRAWCLRGGTVLVAGAWIEADVHIADGRVAAVAEPGPGSGVDARGLLVLPGLIDLHGDACERALHPRPGVAMPLPLALAETDTWLLAAGITTFFASVSDAPEPGLRSRAVLAAWIDALRSSSGLRSAWRLHVRHERCQIEGHDQLLAWLEGGAVHLLSLADHLPDPSDPRLAERYRRALGRRLEADAETVDRLIGAALAGRDEGRRQCAELAALAGRSGVPLASHDDATPQQALASAAAGCRVCEFPADPDTAAAARAAGMRVLMGAPNLVRGGSHVGLMGAEMAVRLGLCDALASDYHFPSLLQAPFVLAQRGVLPLAAAWDLVSAGPAEAAGLDDRGRIAPGLRADLLAIDPDATDRPRMVVVEGRIVASFS